MPGPSFRPVAFRRTTIFAAAVFALVAWLPNPAQAALLAYEGFNYTAGDSLTNASAQGSGGSFGWGGRWYGSPGSFATNAAASLVYVDSLGNTLVTNGGSVIIGSLAGMTANAQPSRSFNIGTLSGNVYSGLTGPSTNWVSFVMQWIGPVTAGSTTNQYVRKGDLVFRAGIATNALSGGTALYSVGSPNAGNRIGTPVDTWATWTGNEQGSGTQNTGLAASSNALNALTFVLMRMELNGTSANDTIYTWFNWTNLASEPGISTATLTNNSANQDGLNNLRLDANGGNAAGTNTVLAFDEFRFGNSFADVTPYSTGPVQPPTITAQPVDASVTVSYPATFSVTAMGKEPIYYQWYFNTNTPLTDQTNASMTIASVDQTNAGGYSCVVSNGGGSVTSRVATLTVPDPVLPDITAQPADWANAVGFPATFSVTATGSAPLSYQWYFNTNTLLSGRTNATLSFIIASTNDAGGYSVVVTNRFGSVTSQVANLTVSAFGLAQLPAFPGAEGAAKLVTGGRGGTVYHVTKLDKNLNDVTPGTLRYGLQNISGPRTIVFDVAGVFWMGRYGAESNYDNGWNAGQSRINWSGNTTIAGQTAPGPVIIMGGVTKMGSANTILRNVMIASGYGMQGFHEPPTTPTPGDFPDSYVYDGIDISGHDLMIDHVTTLYTTDEAISCNELAYNLTIQNCNISQAQNYPQADAEIPGTWAGHALAHLLCAGPGARISVLNNFYAHMTGRLPQVGDNVGGVGALNDFRNCVYYNWDSGGSSGSGPSYDNFINNFHLAGPGGYGPQSRTSSNIVYKAGGTGIFSGGSGCRAYVSGNVKDINKDGDYLDTISADADYSNLTRLTSALDVNIGLTLSAREAFTNVLRHAGNNWWARDYDFRINNAEVITTNDPANIANYINERLIHEAVTGSGNWIAWADDPFNDDPNEGTEWRALLALRADPYTSAAALTRPAGWDTDGDGMPDWWEIEHGLDPSVANNNGDFDNDGYTDLEEYLNELAAWPAPSAVLYTGDKNNRYAELFNWRVYGQQVNITNLGNVTTFSFWQPSRYDTAVISNAAVVVDAVGQHAGTLRLANNATLNITNGWLEASTLEIGAGCTLAVQPAGTLRLTGSGSVTLDAGGTFTNAGVLDIMTWSGTLPAGFVNTGTVLDRSLVRVDSAGVSGSDFEVTIQGYTGHGYQLQYRDDLPGETWQNVGTSVAGANALISFTDTNGASAQRRFYRVAVD